MKTYAFISAILLSTLLLFAAQERTTTGMKIIVVLDAKSNTIPHITPLDSFQKLRVSEVYEKYPGCHFYMGSLKGSYDLIETSVIPAEKAEVTIYTEREFFKSRDFRDAGTLYKGDDFKLGTVMSKVTSNQKGELCLKVKQS